MRKAIWCIGIFFCVFTFLHGAMAAEIKVGTLLSHTGPLKEFGPGIQNGAVLAAKQLAASGFEIEMIHEDSETSAIPATNAAKNWSKLTGSSLSSAPWPPGSPCR